MMKLLMKKMSEADKQKANIEAAYAKAAKTNTLGKGFGGEPAKAKMPMQMNAKGAIKMATKKRSTSNGYMTR